MFTKQLQVNGFTAVVSVRDCLISLVRLPELSAVLGPNGGSVGGQFATVVHENFVPPTVWGNAAEPDLVLSNFLELIDSNAGIVAGPFHVMEYVGRDNSSENLTPDTALDGFLENELHAALYVLSKDQEVLNALKTQTAERILLGGGMPLA